MRFNPLKPSQVEGQVEDGRSKMEDGKPSSILHPPSSQSATLSINEEKNGVELRFPSKPDAETLLKLKHARWRWSFSGKCWYHKHTPENLAWAEAFTGTKADTLKTETLKSEVAPCPLPSATDWRARLLRRPLSA